MYIGRRISFDNFAIKHYNLQKSLADSPNSMSDIKYKPPGLSCVTVELVSVSFCIATVSWNRANDKMCDKTQPLLVWTPSVHNSLVTWSRFVTVLEIQLQWPWRLFVLGMRWHWNHVWHLQSLMASIRWISSVYVTCTCTYSINYRYLWGTSITSHNIDIPRRWYANRHG